MNPEHLCARCDHPFSDHQAPGSECCAITETIEGEQYFCNCDRFDAKHEETRCECGAALAHIVNGRAKGVLCPVCDAEHFHELTDLCIDEGGGGLAATTCDSLLACPAPSALTPACQPDELREQAVGDDWREESYQGYTLRIARLTGVRPWAAWVDGELLMGQGDRVRRRLAYTSPVSAMQAARKHVRELVRARDKADLYTLSSLTNEQFRCPSCTAAYWLARAAKLDYPEKSGMLRGALEHIANTTALRFCTTHGGSR